VLSPLPVDEYVEAIVDRLRRERRLVIVAPPGSGKTTRIPPALTALGKTILLQPRRVAARSLTKRIAAERGWTIGREVGWQIRMERKFSAETALLVATEGILTARLQSDPLLSDFKVIVLDEFHERSVHADLALALSRLAVEARNDLSLVVMSATLDATAVAAFLGNAGVVEITGRQYPVEIEYRPGGRPADVIVDVARGANEGHLLAFFPGQREIEAAREALRAQLPAGTFAILPLHGSLSSEEQDRALAPSPMRKIILSTNIAETSLTVEGVTDVIDMGLHKVLRYDTSTALDRLETERVPGDSAEQRAGRAGRTAPGRAIRLWDSRDQLRLHREPEIMRVDLSAPLLDVMAWGGDPLTFPWFEAPPRERMDAALALLRRLGAIDDSRRITDRGRIMRSIPLHPRLARVLLAGRSSKEVALICAALAEGVRLPPGRAMAATTNSDVFAIADAARRLPHIVEIARDLSRQRELTREQTVAVIRSGGTRSLAAAATSPEKLDRSAAAASDHTDILRALLAGYPDRVARRRERGSPRLQLASGHGAILSRDSGLHEAELMIALDVTGAERDGKSEALVRVASAIEREWLTDVTIEVQAFLENDAVRCVRRVLYDRLVLSEEFVRPDGAAAEALLAEEIGRRIKAQIEGRHHDPLNESNLLVLRRARFARLEIDWGGVVERAVHGKRDVGSVILGAALEFAVRRELDRLAPESYHLPTGRDTHLDYRDGSVVASAKLQELFGLAATPLLGPDRIPLTFELLAPNGRPVQITRDLASFWNGAYHDVRKELRGRYPKHPWPDEPWTATPTARTTRRR
jgi:ATP-dependent helicase HrpB